MKKNHFSLCLIATACTLFAHGAPAGPLTAAEVTKIINHVGVIDPAKGERPAMLREEIKDDLALQTGLKSRSELLFQDNTLTRIGPETFFSFKMGTRDLTLEKGSMLLQVPKGLGGAKIRTAAVTAAITGTTIMMEYVPGHYIKVLVLEGSLRLSRNGTFGDSLLLRPGKMVIMRPDAKKIPDPIDVDLEHIVKTSTLVNFPGGDTLPSMPLIQAAIDGQAKHLVKRDLVPTNLVMGHGTNVILASSDQLAKIVGPLSLLGANGNGGSVAALLNLSATGAGGTLKGGAIALPILGPITANTPSSATAAVNNLLAAVGGVGPVANNLLGVNPTGTAVSVSSSTQLLALLSSAAPGSGGTITIPPIAVNGGASVAALPAGIVQPIIPAGPAGVPSSGNSLPTISAGTVPILNGSTPSVTSPVPALTTLVSAPTTPPTGTLAGPPTSPPSLVPGH